MADTGAPYFIPYVEPTDLVRDYPAADEASADAIAAALDAIPVLAGIGSNVVSTTKTDHFSQSLTSGAFDDITGVEVAITPSDASSLVLVMWTLTGSNSNGSTQASISGRVTRNGTPVGVGTVTARMPMGNGMVVVALNNNDQFATASQVFLDSPGVATAVTYKLQVGNPISQTATMFVNRSPANNAAYSATATTTLTVVEVAA